MNKLFLIVLAIVFSVNLSWADDSAKTEDKKDEINTIFGTGDIKSSGYGAVQTKVTSINGELGLLVGGRGCWTINKSFSIGGGGMGLVSQHEVNYTIKPDTTNINTNINLGYGGLVLEYIFYPRDYMHFSVNTLIGFGGVMYGNMMDSIYHTNNDFNFNNRNSNPSVALFVIEPTASVEFNITKHFRIGLDVSYRYMTSIRENTNYTNSTSLKDVKLNGLSGGLTFQFGCF